VLAVDRISDAGCSRIRCLYDAKLLKPSSELTELDDDTIIVRFGGDKGGHFVQFKFGFTVMNYVQTNSPDAFELCLSLDAPDSYFNLKTLFDLKMDEFEFYFDLKTPPSICLLDFRGSILCDFVYKTSADSSPGEAPLAAIWLNKKYVERTMDDSATRSSGGPYTTLNNTSTINILVDEGIA
jgi:hypothetical protein